MISIIRFKVSKSILNKYKFIYQKKLFSKILRCRELLADEALV